ncbi:hypothetical protein ACWIGW_11155 [Nocardia brasiliensis]
MERALPLCERKRLRTRRVLADTALRLFTEKGFAATIEDLQPRMPAELATTAWSHAGRGWVAANGTGGRAALVDRLHEAFDALPDALQLST